MNFNDKNTIKLLGILITITIIAISAGLFYFSTPNAINVIDFKDKTVEEVKTWINENKLEDQVDLIYQYSEDHEKNTVISQSIMANEVLDKDSTLTIEISNGPDPDLLILLPSLPDMSKDEIIKFFEDNKFTDVTYEYVTSTTISKDSFIEINVDDLEVRRSEMIIVTISIGEENVGVELTMPDFSDYSQENIKAWANTNNITVTFKTVVSTAVDEGKVISQSIKAGEMIKTGDSVTVEISGGQGVEIPNLKKQTQEEVEEWAKENDIAVDFINYYADSTEKGKVISTTPSSGTLTSNATLKVYISLGSVVIPDFVDKKEADVIDWLETTNDSIYSKDNHITYEIKKDDSSNKEPGTILSTNPTKNSVVKLATKVTITVANTKSVQVDSKSNITVDELKTYLEGLEMKLGTQTSSVYHDTISKGKVVRSDSGSKLVGTTINYTVSKGVFEHSSSYSSLSSCQSTVNTAHSQGASGYSCTSTEVYSDTVAKGSIISQGKSSSNSKVYEFKISKGPESVSIKSYAGTLEATFRNEITGKGFIPGTRTEAYSDTVEKGYIISNDNGNLKPGSTINYTVSLGKKETEVSGYTILDLSTKAVQNNPEQTKINIENYLINDRGVPADQVRVTIEAPVGGISEGLLFEYPEAGTYKSDYIFIVKISNGE